MREKLLQDSHRMSESIMWDLQFEAYSQFGPKAWTQHGVPFYLTSNPYIARQYANIAYRYLLELGDRLNRQEPVYLFDLGAGTGRFAFLFLKHFLSLVKNEFQIKYVMTEISQETIASWQEHPLFQEWIQKGMLDFARYHHAEDDQPIQLIEREEKLESGSLKNPCVLLCNYYFDTIPQDLFRVQDGKLEEGKVSISIDPGYEGERHIKNSELIKEVSYHYSYEPIEEPLSYYPEQQKWSEILKDYCRLLSDCPFLFPVASFRTLDHFSSLSKGRFLLLAGDQGVATKQQLQEWGEPEIYEHGTFSVGVSYHALQQYFHKKGGFGLLQSEPDKIFVNMVGVMGDELERFPRLQVAFEEGLNHFSPVNYWRLVNEAIDREGKVSINEVYLLVKLGNWDPLNLYHFLPILQTQLQGDPLVSVRQIKQMMQHCKENFFPVCEEENVFIQILDQLISS